MTHQGLDESDQSNSSFQPRDYNLLVVDDDRDQLAYFENLLKKEGFIVHAADSAEKAIEMMRTQVINLIVSDLHMPEFDGFDFIRHLRGLKPFRATSQVPVIILSCSDNSVEIDLLKLGADMFCEKNKAKTELLQQIKFLLK